MGVDRNLLARIAFRTCISLNETRTMVSMTSNGSGVGVIDKAAMVLSALEAGPASLAELVSLTGLARPTGSTRTEVAAPSGPDPHRLAPEVGEDTHA